MGYTTDFSGEFKLNKKLTTKNYEWLRDFAEETHSEREYPSYYCQWIPTEDKLHIAWDQAEKFYSYIEWIEWLIENFFKPKKYILNGEVEWHGEASDNIGRIVIKDNVVTLKEGKLVFE